MGLRGFRVEGLGFRFCFRVSGLGLRGFRDGVWGSGFALGFSQGLGLRGFRVEGLGFRVCFRV